MDGVTDYRSIGQAADLLGVTTRTLRHWDHIGLLQPGWRTTTDYRLYTTGDIERATQILVYRSAGVALKEIAVLLDEPATATQHLKRQRELLMEQIAHLHRMVRAVDEILEEDTMGIEDKIELFGREWPNHQEEAGQRWGDTPEWEQSQRVQSKMSKADWQSVKDEQEAFVRELVDAAAAGVQPGSEAGNRVALLHRASISQWYEVTAAKQVLLARMYVADERFNQTYQGHAEYLLTLVEALAHSEGVALENVEWD